MDATTVARVKALLDIPDATSTHDAVLGTIVTAVSKRIENYIDRHLESKARTEEYSIKPRQNVLFLRGYPVSAISSIKVAVDWDYAAASALSTSASISAFAVSSGAPGLPRIFPRVKR